MSICKGGWDIYSSHFDFFRMPMPSCQGPHDGESWIPEAFEIVRFRYNGGQVLVLELCGQCIWSIDRGDFKITMTLNEPPKLEFG